MKNDQEFKADGGKETPSLLFKTFAKPLRVVLAILMYGRQKYEANSWMNVPNARERYTEAAYRHQMAIDAGEMLDFESGLSHRAHLIFNQLCLLWFDIKDNPGNDWLSFKKPPTEHKEVDQFAHNSIDDLKWVHGGEVQNKRFKPKEGEPRVYYSPR